MGGVSSDSGEKLNIELNLVPFIDLLSSLVLFLLITAVWVQVSAIPAGIDAKGAVTPATPPPPGALVTVHLTGSGYELRWPAALHNAEILPAHLDKKEGQFDLARLTELVAGIAKDDAKPTAAVSADDSVDYGDVVRAIDTVKQGGLESVALSSN